MTTLEQDHHRRVMRLMYERYGHPHWLGTETYTYTLPNDQGFVTWDITLVKTALQAARTKFSHRGEPLPRQEVPPEELARIATWEIDEAIVATADPGEPGIAAPILGDDGTVYTILIDGVHRAVKAHRLGRPFQAYVLPDEASRACIVAATPGRVP